MSYKPRRRNGEYAYTWERWVAAPVMGLFIAAGLVSMAYGAYARYQESQPLQKILVTYKPLVQVAYAADFYGELKVVDKDAPKTVEQKIRAKFGKHADKMLAIGTCESGLRPEAVGDHKIAFMKNGKQYGKSYGVFQIRHLPGRPEPKKLLDVDTNIEQAYRISKGGTNTRAWVNCSRKVGI